MSRTPSLTDRPPRGEHFSSVERRKFVIAVVAAGIAVLCLFMGNLLYLFGSVYQQASKYHAFHILMVDYDGGIVGESMLAAYQQLKSPSFPTFFARPASDYPSPDDIVQAVRKRQYWAAIYSTPGASDRLAAALLGGGAATTYNASNTLTYVWNEIRYPAASDSILQSSFAELGIAARIAYNHINGTSALRYLVQDDEAAVQAYLDPIVASSINIEPVTQGSKVFYNTISMAMPIIQQFFFILALNGISMRFRLYSRLSPKVSGLVRLATSLFYTFVGSLSMTGYIWAFRENWAVDGGQFALTWMVLWLLMHIYFCVMEFATAVLPPPAMPFITVIWIFLNITSTNSPFEICPGFYRWGYALPGYETYQVLTDIWSGGGSLHLYRALPILFSWWIVGLVLASLGHRRTCRKGVKSAMVNSGNAYDDRERAASGAGDMARDEAGPIPNKGSTAVTEPIVKSEDFAKDRGHSSATGHSTINEKTGSCREGESLTTAGPALGTEDPHKDEKLVTGANGNTVAVEDGLPLHEGSTGAAEHVLGCVHSANGDTDGAGLESLPNGGTAKNAELPE
ncbi:Domain of unknown function DUF3533 [Lasallia pustulata]|uniref:DUF3533 domain-containing protein n=1 Tax=Lasallia pustulata TaxID=136370 RepID=A0A1W5CUB8_9LECA|nr:Domain of unknown function DUF3533 [Lasallia pustulata]